MSLSEKIFGKKVSADEMCKKWRLELRKQQRDLDRNIREIDVGEAKLKQQIRERAKAGDSASAKLLARELVNARKAKTRLYTSKAQLNSVALQLQQQAAMLRVSGAMQRSTQVMQMMGQLCRVPQMQAVMMAMGKEMARAGLIEEMMDDTLAQGEDGEEEAADEEVEAAFAEVTASAARVPTHALPAAAAPAAAEPEEDEEDRAAAQRLAALKV